MLIRSKKKNEKTIILVRFTNKYFEEVKDGTKEERDDS